MSGRRRLAAGVRERAGVFQVRWRTAAGVERSATFPTAAEAIACKAAVERDKRWGFDQDPARGRITVAAWAQLREPHQVARPSTLARQRSALRTHVLPAVGAVELVRLTSFEVQRWVTDLVGAGLAPATVRGVHQTLSRLLADAVADGRLAHNPCQGARLPELPVVEARFLDPDDVVALEAARAELAPHWAELVPFMADTALRIGEVAGLQVRDVDRAAGTVRVRRTVVEVEGKRTTGAPKTLAGRRVVPTLTDDVAGLVARRVARLGLAADDPLFGGPSGAQLRPPAFRRRVWGPAVARSGLAAPLTTPHSVRHRAIAAWIAAGATNPYHLARWAGHRDVGTVFRLDGHLLPVDASAGRAALAAFRRQALARRADGGVPAARREPER